MNKHSGIKDVLCTYRICTHEGFIKVKQIRNFLTSIILLFEESLFQLYYATSYLSSSVRVLAYILLE